jgi:hypothetical protein
VLQECAACKPRRTIPSPAPRCGACLPEPLHRSRLASTARGLKSVRSHPTPGPMRHRNFPARNPHPVVARASRMRAPHPKRLWPPHDAPLWRPPTPRPTA